MEKTESNDHPTFHPQDFDPTSRAAKRARGTVQELAFHASACMRARALVWILVDEALNLFFPRSKLQQRFLDARAVAPPFRLTPPPLIYDKSLETTRRIALAAFRAKFAKA